MKEPNKEKNRTNVGIADIQAHRKRIDAIDDQILELVNQRLISARAIGGIKRQTGAEVVDSRREGDIYQRLLSLNKGPLATGALFRIFGSAIAAGRSIQNQRGPAKNPSPGSGA